MDAAQQDAIAATSAPQLTILSLPGIMHRAILTSMHACVFKTQRIFTWTPRMLSVKKY
jgi:hypothetical protein